ncbi:MAG: helix-turn-helix transcriptional regulator [Streptococcaceae bacterium]|jgi:DNA-binding HxlR family transcriptional regulator|nr:helix-turn-helix transcriptional regulator [Streptococcaceae bacterium]
MKFEIENDFVKNSQIHGEFCPLDTTLKILSGRWKTIILNRLMKEELHFNELARRIPNCSRRMLALQLHELAAAQIIVKQVKIDQGMAKISYQLTSLGRSLLPVVWAMNDWGRHYIETFVVPNELEESCQG